MKKIFIPKDELVYLYFGRNYSLRDLCRHYRHDLKTILKLLNAHGIKRRTALQAWRIRRQKLLGEITQEYLQEEYNVRRVSIKNLSQKLGIHKKTLRRLMCEFGIRIMSKAEMLRGKKKSEEHRLKILVVPRPNKHTLIERLVEDELAKREIGHYVQLPILGVCQSDFAFPDERIAVFCDGEYWHSLPKAVEKDARVNTKLAAAGWLVLRFRERDIKNNSEKIVDFICQELMKRRETNGCTPAQVEKESSDSLK